MLWVGFRGVKLQALSFEETTVLGKVVGQYYFHISQSVSLVHECPVIRTTGFQGSCVRHVT